MLNILPDATKENKKHAKLNAIISGWSIAFMFGTAVVAAQYFVGSILINKSISSIKLNTESLKSELPSTEAESTRKDYTEFSSNLSLVTGILKKQVLFSQILSKLGNILPPGATLETINLTDNDTFLNLTVKAPDRQTGNLVPVNMLDPSKNLFSAVDVTSFSCSSASSGDKSATPGQCTVAVKAKFVSNSEFLLINNYLKEIKR
jgi:hypothetical protein